MKWWKDEMDTQARVGACLRKLRIEYNLTQLVVAKTIRCHPSAISTLELGKWGSLKLVEAYAWALGLELSDLDVKRPGITFINSARRRRQEKMTPAPVKRKPMRHAVRRVA